MSDTFFLIIGIVLTVIGFGYLALRIKHRISLSARVVAEVASVQREKIGFWKGKTRYQYFPSFTYSAGDKSYTAKSAAPVRKARSYKKGDSVAIRYNPKAPGEIDAGGRVLSCIVSFLIGAGGVTVIACYFL